MNIIVIVALYVLLIPKGNVFGFVWDMLRPRCFRNYCLACRVNLSDCVSNTSRILIYPYKVTYLFALSFSEALSI
jgi:hypothetical protein